MAILTGEAVAEVPLSRGGSGADDHVALWSVAFNADGDREETLRVLAEVLEEGLAVAGTPRRDGGFVAFGETPEETVRRAASGTGSAGTPTWASPSCGWSSPPKVESGPRPALSRATM